ncbi:MAG: hypothetical protein IPM45_03585 [Acidimicrobiales bacterium]|nr:hypothetical protein [Acidimicrobiales bacterium]
MDPQLPVPVPVPVPRRVPVTLADLPPTLADRLRFDVAAPRAVRQPAIPPEARRQFRAIWDSLVAELAWQYQHTGYAEARTPRDFERRLRRITPVIDQAERAVIYAGTHFPMPGGNPWAHIAYAGTASGGLTAVDQVLTYGSAGAAFAVAAATAVISELFDVYVAASARSRQYLRAGRDPDAEMVAVDLGEALAGAGVTIAGRATRRRAAAPALLALAERLVRRSVSRFAKALLLVAGIGWAAASSARVVQKVTTPPLAPVDPDEAARLLRDAAADWLFEQGDEPAGTTAGWVPPPLPAIEPGRPGRDG